MFGEKGETMEGAETIVGIDVVVKGNLKSPSNIMVNGTVKGKVNSSADVTVGETAKIEGSISCRKLTISGTVQGNVEASESLEILSSGKIYGDISTSNLVIQAGAVFNGKSTMEETPQTEEGEAQEKTEEEAKEIFEKALSEEEKVETKE